MIVSGLRSAPHSPVVLPPALNQANPKAKIAMTHLPHSDQGSYSSGSDSSASHSASPQVPTPDPTLSVSAHHAPAWPHGSGYSNGNGNSGGNGTNGVPPRLGELVNRAEGSIGELERLTRTTLDATSAAAQASAELQERLRLGVRMLQAFDVQIQRSEQVAGQAPAQLHPQVLQQLAAQIQAHVQLQVQNQLQGQLAAIAQQCEMRVRAATDGFERRLAETLPFLDERVRAAHEQIARLVEDRLANAERSIEDRHGPVRDDLRRYADELVSSFAVRLDGLMHERSVATPNASDCDARLTALLASIEQRATVVDTTVARAEERMRQLDRQSTEAADALLGTVGTAATLKDLVADEARECKRLADEAGTTTRELQRELSTIVERCMTSRATLTHDLAKFVDAARSADQRTASVKALQSELEALITRLAPWESLVRGNGQPIQHVVETVSSSVRQSIGDELKSFSHALRSLANRAEHAFATGSLDEFSALRVDATPTATTPAPATPHEVPRTSVLPIETRRLTAEILALDSSSLMKPNANV